MKKEKIRVLIIEDVKDEALAICEILRKMLESLGVESEFCHMAKYEEAKLKLESETYDIISLDGVLGNHQSTYPLIKKILEFNPGAIAFSLSSDYEQVRNALSAGLCFGFLKEFNFLKTWCDQIICPKNLEEIKKAVESKVKYQIFQSELKNPVVVFSENYADSTSSERYAKENCDSVAKELTKNHIYFAAVDGDFFVEILVSSDDRWLVQEAILKSGLGYWQDWFAKRAK